MTPPMTPQRSTERQSDGGPIPLVRLYLMGEFRAFRGGHSIPSMLWDRRVAARTLVKILAAVPARRMHREQMIEILWPNAEAAAGPNRLAKALHAARHVLEPDLPTRATSSYLSLEEEMLSLHRHNVWIDADEFERTAQKALAAGTADALQVAANAYSGELLPRERYADWAAERRETVTTLYLEVLAALAGIREQAGEHREAIDHLRAALSVDETPETLHRSLMRLYTLAGQRHRALRQYQRLSDVLHREFTAIPDSTTQALFAAIREGRFPESERLQDRGTRP